LCNAQSSASPKCWPFIVAQISVHSVEVEGTAFRITLSDGHVLGQEELPGSRLMIGDGSSQQRIIRIDAVGDPHHHLVEVSAIARLRTTPA
jgi:hypothetical protein